MPKHGFSLDTVPPILINTVDKLGWSLCIGAGTSTPLFPDWYSLVETLSTNILPPELHLTHSDLTKTGFSADALLQAVKNLSEYKSDNFSTAISSALYQNFKSLVDPSEWRAICDVLNSNYWEQTKLDARRIFVKYRNTLLKDLTCTKISYIVIKAIKANNAPSSILSFNAEPLMFHILNSLLSQEKAGDSKHSKIPKDLRFSKVLGITSDLSKSRIPYYFCHGLLPVEDCPHEYSFSVENLVFSEEEYLRLANEAFSWQSSSFLNACQNHNLVFIGVSLTDPNMRRWLSWVNHLRLEDIKHHDASVKDSTQHYWITKIPKNDNKARWMEACVSHLGVRIIWINDWNEVDKVLSKMLGIQDKKAAKPATTKSRKGTARKGKNWRSKNTSTSSFAEYHKKHR